MLPEQPLSDKRIYLCLWLALTLAAVARALVASSTGMAMLLILFWAVFNAAGLLYASAQRSSQVTPQAQKISEGLAVFGLVIFLLVLLSGAGIVQSLLTLMLCILGAKNPVVLQRRDAHFLLLGSLVVMMWAAGKSFDTWFVLLLAAYALALLMALALLYQQKSGEHPASIRVQEQPGVAAGYSWRYLGVFSFTVLLLALCWYLLVPRPAAMHYGALADTGGNDYWNQEWLDQAEARSGSDMASGWKQAESHDSAPDDVKTDDDAVPAEKSVTAASAIKTDDAEYIPSEIALGDEAGRKNNHANLLVMFVDADRPLYLRQKVFDHFAHDRWTQTETALEMRRLSSRGLLTLLPLNPSPRTTSEVKYSVQLVRKLGTQALPLSADIKEVRFPAAVLALGDDETVLAPGKLGAGTQYSGVAYLPQASTRAVTYAESLPAQRYLQLPEDFTPEMQSLSASAAGSSTGEEQRALAIENYLRSHYHYSMESVFSSQGVTPMQAFLFQTYKGHCEHFATAMALLLRAQGIPSRVVHGFSATSYNPVTGYYEVHRFDGHAWVEGFIAGAGWLTFEPTPAYALPQRTDKQNVTLENLHEYTKDLAAQEKRLGQRSWKETAAQLMNDFMDFWHESGARLDMLLAKIMTAASEHLVLALATVALLLALALGAYQLAPLLWYFLGALLLRMGGRRSPLALRAIHHLSRIGRSRGLGRRYSETLDEYLERIAQLQAGAETSAQHLSALANRACYAPARVAALTAAEKSGVIADFHQLARLILDVLRRPASA